MQNLTLSIRIRLLDKPLLNRTFEEYEEAVDSGRMTEREAEDNITALYVGMAVYEFAD